MLSSLQLTDHSKKLRNLPAARRAGEVFRFGGAARYSSLGGRRGIPVWGGRRGIPVWGGGEVFRFGGRRGIQVWGGGEVFRFKGGAARYSGLGGRRGIPVRRGAARYSGLGGRRALPGRALHPQGVGAHPKTFGEGRRGIPVRGGGELFLEELSTPRVSVPIPKPSVPIPKAVWIFAGQISLHFVVYIFLQKRRALPRTALHPLLYCKYWFPLDVPYIGSIPGLGLTLCYWVYNRGRRAVLGRALHFES